MENGETCQQAAARETLEEAGARVVIDDLYALFSLPHIDQVYMLFRGRLLDLDFAPGEESLEVRLFRAAELPWRELAFPVVEETMGLYVRDWAANHFPLRSGDILRLSESPRRYRVTHY
jgi:8-oxo-dGTP pyrophosphatase MutT (NUDIX family)